MAERLQSEQVQLTFPELAAEELEERLARRNEALRDADRTSPDAIRLGASNAPGDPDVFAVDYRSRLALDDPARYEGIGDGSAETPRSMEVAHREMLRILAREDDAC